MLESWVKLLFRIRERIEIVNVRGSSTPDSSSLSSRPVEFSSLIKQSSEPSTAKKKQLKIANCNSYMKLTQYFDFVFLDIWWVLAMLSLLTLPGRLPGSGRFLFEQPKQLHGRLPGNGCLPGMGHYGIPHKIMPVLLVKVIVSLQFLSSAPFLQCLTPSQR